MLYIFESLKRTTSVDLIQIQATFTLVHFRFKMYNFHKLFTLLDNGDF